MANDIICEISSENELICEMSSAGEIVVEINGMTYQSVSAELAEKASVEDVALKADKTYVDTQNGLKADITYVDNQDLLKADKTEVTALANKVPSAKELVTVTGKNQYYPIVEDNTGAIVGRRLANIWDGTSWVAVYSNGFGHVALSNNTGVSSNGFGYASLRDNTGACSNGFGHASLRNNTGALSNGFGYNSLYNNAGASSNGFGYNSLRNNTGAYNSAFGHNANNTTDTTINAYTNTTCLGANTLPNKSNQVVLGDGSVNTVKMGGTARTPASSTALGVKGETCWDTNYFYICVATNIWKRIPMEAW